MKRFGRLVMGSASAGLYLAMLAASANAQQASFKLPMAAHWGGAVLQPGEYKVHFPNGSESMRVIEVSGNGKTLRFIPQVTAYARDPIEVGQLSLIGENGDYKVSSITDPIGNRTFTFSMPKSAEKATSSVKRHNSPKINVPVQGIG